MEKKQAFSIILTQEQYKWLKRKSDETGIAMTNLVRLILNKEIKKDETN